MSHSHRAPLSRFREKGYKLSVRSDTAPHKPYIGLCQEGLQGGHVSAEYAKKLDENGHLHLAAGFSYCILPSPSSFTHVSNDSID